MPKKKAAPKDNPIVQNSEGWSQKDSRYALHLMLPSVNAFLAASQQLENLVFVPLAVMLCAKQDACDGAIEWFKKGNKLLACQSPLVVLDETMNKLTGGVRFGAWSSGNWHSLALSILTNLQSGIYNEFIVQGSVEMAREQGVELHPAQVRQKLVVVAPKNDQQKLRAVIHYQTDMIEQYWNALRPLLERFPAYDPDPLVTNLKVERAQVADHLRNLDEPSVLIEEGVHTDRGLQPSMVMMPRPQKPVVESRHDQSPSDVETASSSDTEKKPKKYRMDSIARQCAEDFKKLIDSGERQTLHHFVIDWCAEESKRLKKKVHPSTIEKRLGQNRNEWDPDGKYKNIRAPR